MSHFTQEVEGQGYQLVTLDSSNKNGNMYVVLGCKYFKVARKPRARKKSFIEPKTDFKRKGRTRKVCACPFRLKIVDSKTTRCTTIELCNAIFSHAPVKVCTTLNAADGQKLWEDRTLHDLTTSAMLKILWKSGKTATAQSLFNAINKYLRQSGLTDETHTHRLLREMASDPETAFVVRYKIVNVRDETALGNLDLLRVPNDPLMFPLDDAQPHAMCGNIASSLAQQTVLSRSIYLYAYP